MRRKTHACSVMGDMAGDFYMQWPPTIHHYPRWLDWSAKLLLQFEVLVPGVNAELKLVLPETRSSMVELQYLYGNTGIITGINLSKNPLLKFSGFLGKSFFRIGTDICFDAKTATLAKCDAGLSFNSSILSASLNLNEKGHFLTASSCLAVNSLSNSAFAVEMTHRFLSNQTTFNLGTQFSPTPSTLLKARLGIDGTVHALLQQQLFSVFFVTVEGKLNVKDAKSSAKLGLSCALKYKIRQM